MIQHISRERVVRMKTIYVKLRLRKNECKYRKMLSTDENVFVDREELIDTEVTYAPDVLLDDGEWFKIENASQQSYAIDVIKEDYSSLDYDSLTKKEFSQIDFLFVENRGDLFFQKVGRAGFVCKKRIGSFGEAFQYQSNSQEIVINDSPDAIYCKNTDILYFRRLEAITGIFKGIDELYKEATSKETELFLKNDFIALKDDYCASKVKTANRKRIALVMDIMETLDEENKKNLVTYIGDYCSQLKEGNAFAVSNENDLKLVLLGIQQRFYTTPIGGEKRIANSVITM